MKVRLPNNGGMGNMQEMLRQAQQMQQDMEDKRAELETAIYEVSAGGGAVTVRISGAKRVQSIEIDPALIDPDDPETLQDILTAAVNEAIKKAEDTEAEEMAKITGPMSGALGGMGGFPGGF